MPGNRATCGLHGIARGETKAANATSCVDKGHFRTRDGRTCYPLTLIDAHTRYLLRCEIVEEPDGSSVQAIFDSAFREFSESPWRCIRTTVRRVVATRGSGCVRKPQAGEHAVDLDKNGAMRWRGQTIFVSGALACERVILEGYRTRFDAWNVVYHSLVVGVLSDDGVGRAIFKPRRR